MSLLQSKLKTTDTSYVFLLVILHHFSCGFSYLSWRKQTEGISEGRLFDALLQNSINDSISWVIRERIIMYCIGIKRFKILKKVFVMLNCWSIWIFRNSNTLPQTQVYKYPWFVRTSILFNSLLQQKVFVDLSYKTNHRLFCSWLVSFYATGIRENIELQLSFW